AIGGVEVAIAPAGVARAQGAAPVGAAGGGVITGAGGAAGAAVARVLRDVDAAPAAALHPVAKAGAAGVVGTPRHALRRAARRLADLARGAMDVLDAGLAAALGAAVGRGAAAGRIAAVACQVRPERRHIDLAVIVGDAAAGGALAPRRAGGVAIE